MLSFLSFYNMAKSKSGGTRSYLRGRIASDVYSIGRDASGKKQQVVRSLAESVKNPQTIAQMRGRMIMSTVMQAVSALSQIVDHSFDGVSAGQPSLSEFIRRNYALIKADVQAHPATNNNFGLVKYGDKGIKGGHYIVSDGKAIESSFAYAGFGTASDATIQTAAEVLNLANLKRDVLNGNSGYVTFVYILADGTAAYVRVHFSDTADQATAITEENFDQFITIENPMGLTITKQIGSGTITLSISKRSLVAGQIFTWNDGKGGFIHSTSVLGGNQGYDFAADVALPTYPLGEERFLNGGEL